MMKDVFMFSCFDYNTGLWQYRSLVVIGDKLWWFSLLQGGPN